MLTTQSVDIATLKKDFPNFQFTEAREFYWSSLEKTIFYSKRNLHSQTGSYQLLHEIGHALSQHQSFESGIELLKMEVEAWQVAEKIAENYHIVINPSYIESCIDSYRDWLFVRSTCPLCEAVATEIKQCQYRCFNCAHQWQVPSSQRSRCYRRSIKKKTKT